MANHSANVGKLVEELIQKHQAEADDLALSEKAKYGDSSTVSTYTWLHSMKAAHQKYVRDLMDIQTTLDNAPTLSPDDVRGVGEWINKTMSVPNGHGQTYNRWGCSKCKAKFKTRTNYCPNCGARLRNGGTDDS